MSILLSVLQVLLALVVFACAVLANPHWGGYYGPGPSFDWPRFRGRNYGRLDDDRIIIIIQDGPTSDLLTPVPSSADPTAASTNTLPATTVASVTAG